MELNAALKELTHEDARLFPRKTEEKKDKHFCFISGKLMSKYLEKTGGSSKEHKQCSITDVNMPKHFTPEQRRRVKTICHKYEDVYIRVKSGKIPPPMKNVKLHVFKMKDDVKPIYCKRPN